MTLTVECCKRLRPEDNSMIKPAKYLDKDAYMDSHACHESQKLGKQESRRSLDTEDSG